MSRKTQAPREKATDRDEENAWMTADEEFAPLKLSSKEQEELEERREAGVMMADRRMDELGAGDSRCARQLPGAGPREEVARVKKCTSCVFDDTFYFNFKDLSRSAIEEATIDVMVYDFDVFSAHDLIGMASFDAKKIHDLEAHEYYRQWVGLVDNLDTGDNGYQGFLKLSVTVLGPGDDQKAHDLDAEYQRELDAEMDEGELGGMALSGPSVDSKLTAGAGALQNRYGNEATTYRGRVLLSMELMTRPSSREKTVSHRKNFHFKPTPGLKPATARYHLLALAVMGTEIPTFRSAGFGGTAKMKLVVAIGNHRLDFAFEPNRRGVLGLGLSEDAVDPDLNMNWQEAPLLKKAETLKPYCLRVYVYQARNLPASDENGLDPTSRTRALSFAPRRSARLNEKFDRPMSIVPQMRVAWVEVTCVGVRQLKTHRLRTPREPYVRCDVPAPDDGGGTFKTKASRQPSGRNANFLSRHVMSVEMPENASPLLGATSVDLSTKMSWNGEGYVPPQMELFEDSDAKRRADEREEEERAKAAAADAEDEEEENDGGAGAGSVGISFGGGDDGDANEEDDDLNDGEDVDQHDDLPMIYEDLLYEEEQERLAQELAAQDAAADNEITFLDMVEARLANATDVNALVDGDVHYKMSELPIAFPNQWAARLHRGREWWMDDRGTELENYLKTKPFETYPRPALEEEPFFPMKLLRATPYTVRVYVIRGVNLQPAEGVSADPYLRVKLGSEVDDRSKTHRRGRQDWNRFYPIHELLGETKIDLEDRWFHREWQSLDEKKEGTTNPLKPIEVRGLRTDTNPVAQGQVHMWLEIRPEHETRREPAVHLEGPEKMKFEVRVICWKSKDVPFEMGDYFAEFWIGQSRKQKTDVHWRCRNGKASWNWRVKIPVELPLDSPEMGRLNIQLWDQDIIKWNDVIGECQVDLYRWFLKAYHEKRSVNAKEEKPEGDEAEKEEGEEKPLLDEAKKKEDKDEKEDDDKDDGPKPVDAGDKDAAYFVKQFKDFIGLGEIDDTAQWIKMTINDRKRKRLLTRGSLAITIEILPEDEAGDRPAGHGRTEPNANPYLPPTTGRMSFSYNPLAICSALLGPKLAFQIICCLCCILILVAIGFLGMYFVPTPCSPWGSPAGPPPRRRRTNGGRV
ncbi:hypothetical protein JL720_4254 [Aureococcus anophagefferens]|nr:hypothetical protein JL720_4254 [Aureococcus anophagefferens]